LPHGYHLRVQMSDISEESDDCFNAIAVGVADEGALAG
jgi:hypothetical protein